MGSKLEEKLVQLDLEKSKLLKLVDQECANKTFKCGCGKSHKIKQCVALKSHYYEGPTGCTGGDYWAYSELQVVCPDTDNKNRFLYDSKYSISWDLRNHYAHSAEMQFNRKYIHLFKEVIDVYGDDKRKWWNNYYVDKNHEKFGIHIGI